MAIALNKTSLELKRSIDPNDYNDGNWILWGNKLPARSITAGEQTVLDTVDKKYWKIELDQLAEMTQPEKDVVDAAEAAEAAEQQARADDLNAIKNTLQSMLDDAQTVIDGDISNLTQANTALDLLAQNQKKIIKGLYRIINGGVV